MVNIMMTERNTPTLDLIIDDALYDVILLSLKPLTANDNPLYDIIRGHLLMQGIKELEYELKPKYEGNVRYVRKSN